MIHALIILVCCCFASLPIPSVDVTLSKKQRFVFGCDFVKEIMAFWFLMMHREKLEFRSLRGNFACAGAVGAWQAPPWATPPVAAMKNEPRNVRARGAPESCGGKQGHTWASHRACRGSWAGAAPCRPAALACITPPGAMQHCEAPH